MIWYGSIGLIFVVIYPALGLPVPLADDFPDFLRNAQSKGSVTVKRRTVDDTADEQLKQISLGSLIGDLEKNIFASALSLNKVLTNTKDSVPEIKVSDDSEPDVNKRQSATEETINSESPAGEPASTIAMDDKVIFQTTEKVAQANGLATHIVIDHISIQPHTEGLALIPIFQLKDNKKNENASKNHETTKITISKTEIINSATTAQSEPSSSSSSTSSFTSVPSAGTSTSTEATLLKTATTPKNIEQLKDAEEELKEKFAEIEAEPVILSARV